MHWWQKKQRNSDLERELQSDLELEEEEQRERGLSPKEAQSAAKRAFGNIALIKEQTREAWGWTRFERLWQDLRYATRQLRRSPGFAITAMLTLALGIGAATSVFSVVNAVLLKPFAFRDSDRLVVMRETMQDKQRGEFSPTPDNYRHFVHLKKDAKTLEDAAIFAQVQTSVSSANDHPRIVGAIVASPNLFHLLGAQTILGRGFLDSDARKGSDNVVVLSYQGWQELFAGEPAVIGKTLHLGGDPVTVIGVLPLDFRFPRIALAPQITFQETASSPLLFAPLTPSERDLNQDMGNFNYKAIARLKPEVSLTQSNAELQGLQNAYTRAAHLPLRFGIALTPLAKDVASGVSGALWLLFVAVGAVLLIACVNLANLQLARAVNAERETAVRAALGASRVQLLRSRLVESLILALIGGTAGIGLTFLGVRLLLSLAPADVPRLDEVHVSMPVFLFAASLSIMVAVAFGILPALHSLHVPPQAALQANSQRAANTQQGGRTRSAMVAAQVACTIVLLIVTSLALRSFSHLLRQDRGFDVSHITLEQVDLFTPAYDNIAPKQNAARLAFADRALIALARLPGVQSVALTSVAPLTGETWVDDLSRPDHLVPAWQRLPINVRWINSDYLSTMQSRLISGRNIATADRANPYVALISERTAREAFPGENPVGRKIDALVPDNKHAITVIGVVADARINGLKDTAPMVYLPYWAFTPVTISFLVRSIEPSKALIPEIRRAIWEIDSQVAIPTLKSMDSQVSESVAGDRFQTILLTAFGLAALFLALLGIHGVLAYSVSLRQQEFGIRIALGSDKTALIGLVLRQIAQPVLLGTGIGLTVALIALRWARSLVYQTLVIDPLAIVGSIGLLLFATAIATIAPARKATSIDPIRSLRME